MYIVFIIAENCKQCQCPTLEDLLGKPVEMLLT